MKPRLIRKLVVMVSGTGSLLQAMIKYGLPIEYVITDKPCDGLGIAEAAGISTYRYRRTCWGWDNSRHWQDQPNFDRVGFSTMIARGLNRNGINVVAMAGFMTILAPEFFEIYDGEILNIHPSLLPAFKGESAVRDALEYGVKITGTTIHFATPDLDAGPIISQRAVEVMDYDTPEKLHARIKRAEQALYPMILLEVLRGTLEPPVSTVRSPLL